MLGHVSCIQHSSIVICPVGHSEPSTNVSVQTFKWMYFWFGLSLASLHSERTTSPNHSHQNKQHGTPSHQHHVNCCTFQAAQAQVKVGGVAIALAGAGPAQSCDKVWMVWNVEVGGDFFCYWQVGGLGCLHKTGRVVWCLSNPPLFFLTSLFQSSSSSLPASSHLLSIFFYPILFLPLLMPLLPGDVYTLPRSHLHHPLHL